MLNIALAVCRWRTHSRRWLVAANRRFVACHAFLANFSWGLMANGGGEGEAIATKILPDLRSRQTLLRHEDSMNACPLRLSVRVMRVLQHSHQADNESFRCRSTSTSRRCPRTKCRTSTRWGRSTASSSSYTNYRRTTMRPGEQLAKKRLCGMWLFHDKPLHTEERARPQA